MKAFSLALLTDHDSVQLNRKAIITPLSIRKKHSPFPLNFVTWPQDDCCKPKKTSVLRPIGLLFAYVSILEILEAVNFLVTVVEKQ